MRVFALSLVNYSSPKKIEQASRETLKTNKK